MDGIIIFETKTTFLQDLRIVWYAVLMFTNRLSGIISGGPKVAWLLFVSAMGLSLCLKARLTVSNLFMQTFDLLLRSTSCDSEGNTWWSEGENFKIAQWPKGFFVQPAITRTVTWEQLVAMFFFHQMSFNLSHCRTVYCFSNQSYNENKTIHWENLMNFVAVAIVSAIVLGHPFNKRVVFWLV